jgi:hypothetical protein
LTKITLNSKFLNWDVHLLFSKVQMCLYYCFEVFNSLASCLEPKLFSFQGFKCALKVKLWGLQLSEISFRSTLLFQTLNVPINIFPREFFEVFNCLKSHLGLHSFLRPWLCLEIFFQENFLRFSIVWDFIWNYAPFFQDPKCTFEIIFQENFLRFSIVWNIICNYAFSFQNLKCAFGIFFKQFFFWGFSIVWNFVWDYTPSFQDLNAMEIFFPKKLFEIFNWLKFPLGTKPFLFKVSNVL